MSTTATPLPTPDPLLGQLWPDEQTPGRPRLVGASLGVGVLAAVVVPFRDLGLGTFLVLAAMITVVGAAVWSRVDRTLLANGVLCLLLCATVMVRDAEWITVLCVLAAFAVGSVTLTGGRSVPGLLASMPSVPLAGLRGMPWLGRSLRMTGRPAQWWPFVRTAALSVVLVAVFGALFASADAIFARWVGALVPDLTFETMFARGFVLALCAGVTLAGVFVALVPPRVERLAAPTRRPVRWFEWAVPVGVVVLLFLVFLGAQLAALFGGHAYLQRTGLTYADYVHEGFGQLTLVTVLTLAVVAAAVRRAPRATSRDRTLLRGLLGLLCVLALVVVASALHRMHVYEEAYGFTRLRLLVSVFEAWLGLVVLLVLAAGVTLRGPWVPRAALLTGAVMLLGLAALNPDAYIAERNIERFEQTGRVDWSYLGGLSDDAVPAFESLPENLRACAVGSDSAPSDDDWLEWNLGRSRAAQAGTAATASTSTSWCG